MARKGGRKDDDRQRRAMHARMNDANGKGAKKGRSLSSDDASEMARRRWQKFEDSLPEVSLEDIARIQAARSPAARRRDAMSTSASVIDPRSKRAALWVKDPLHHDLLGIDTEPVGDVKPKRPQRPQAGARRHGDGPSRSDEAVPRAPRLKPKAPRSQEPQPPEEPLVAEPEPEPAKEPEPEPPQAPPSAKKARRPAEVQAPEPVAPEPGPAVGDGEEQPQVVLSRDHAREALELASWKPPELGVVPEVLPMHKDGVMTRLARLVTSDPAQVKKAAEYDLAEGGFLTSLDRRITVFDPDARRRLGGGDAANLSTRLGIPLKAGLSGLWRSAPRDRVNVELDRFLQELDAPPGTKLVPIRDELFHLADVEAVAKALPGPVSLDAIPEGHLVVMQGNVAVAVKPASRQEKQEHSQTAQAIIRKRNGHKPRSPKEAALMQKVPTLRHGAKPRPVPGKKKAEPGAAEIENAAPAQPAANPAPQGKPKAAGGQAARAKKASEKPPTVKSVERDLLVLPRRASGKPLRVKSAERDLLVPPRRAPKKQPPREQPEAKGGAASPAVAPEEAANQEPTKAPMKGAATAPKKPAKTPAKKPNRSRKKEAPENQSRLDL